jgi:hypothetical protein
MAGRALQSDRRNPLGTEPEDIGPYGHGFLPAFTSEVMGAEPWRSARHRVRGSNGESIPKHASDAPH